MSSPIPTPTQGTCLCGAVTLTVSLPTSFGACHCTTCRRWGGGPFLAVNCGTQVGIQGLESVGVFNSSEWAERGFCTQCGTHLFYRLKGTQEHYIPLGVLGDVDLAFGHQVFIDQKPTCYSFAEVTPTMTAAEIFAQFGGE